MSEIVVAKLGGSVITRKAEDKAKVNEEALKRLCKEVSEALSEGDFKLVLVHGAGPFGHLLAKKYDLAGGLKSDRQIQGMAVTHQSMEELNGLVVRCLQEIGVNAIGFQPSAAGILKDRMLESFQVDTVRRMLDIGLVPVAYGDVLLDIKTGINILSGDHLVPYLARNLPADRVVISTDVDGIFSSDPKDGGESDKIDVITRDNIGDVLLSGSKATDVTGGMERKVRELLGLSGDGITSQVFSGLVEGELKRALLGLSESGTFIR